MQALKCMQKSERITVGDEENPWKIEGICYLLHKLLLVGASFSNQIIKQLKNDSIDGYGDFNPEILTPFKQKLQKVLTPKQPRPLQD